MSVSELKILFVSANPRDTDKPLSVEKKRVCIERKIDRFKGRYDFKNWDGITPEDFQTCLSDFKPNVLHFTGHANEGVPVFLNKDDEGQQVPEGSFIRALSLYKEHIKCVVLNACYTSVLAEKISKHIKCVIGSPSRIKDPEAQAFSPFFYYSNLDGDSVGDAFDKAKTQVGIGGGRESVFEIHCDKDVDPGNLYLISVPKKESTDILVKKKDQLRTEGIQEKK